MQIFWFLPTHGDSRYLGSTEGARTVDLAYLQQIAGAADKLGYEGVLIPTGRSCEDPWVIASSLIGATRNLKFLVAVRPGLHQPSLAARMAATFDRLSGGRLLVNLVTGGDQAELEGDGVSLGHAERYEQSAEFIRIWREILARSHDGQSFDYEGQHLSVKGAKLLFPPVQKPYPPVWFGGSSAAAHELAAEQVDAYLTWGEPPAEVGKKIADVRNRAARKPPSRAWIRKASAAWRRCTPGVPGAPAPTSRFRPTSGPAWDWCAAARAPHWWAIRRPWRRASRSTRHSASTSSFSRATRISKRPTASRSWCSRCSRARLRPGSRAAR